MTCRDRNRLALQADLLGAMALGMRNVLVLTGDDPKAGDQPDTKAVNDLTSATLLNVANTMRRDHKLPPGTDIKGPVGLVLGAADAPSIRRRMDAESLTAKIEAGADFVQTQFCMDAGVVRRYAARLGELGLTKRVKILVGVAPIPSARSARWMRERLRGTIIPDAIVERLEGAADAKAEGRKICVELLQELAGVPGVAGAHVMAPRSFFRHSRSDRPPQASRASLFPFSLFDLGNRARVRPIARSLAFAAERGRCAAPRRCRLRHRRQREDRAPPDPGRYRRTVCQPVALRAQRAQRISNRSASRT